MPSPLSQLLSAITEAKKPHEPPPEAEVIRVSETVSVAASVYESLRNTLEYDEEHLLRRNAIRRILKRRLDEEGDATALSLAMLRELIWARYLPNGKIHEKMIGSVASLLSKHRLLFHAARKGTNTDVEEAWVLDVASTEIERLLHPSAADEELASLAYSELKRRMKWMSDQIAEQDRDLQLYIAVHRSVLKSNTATLRYRLLTLYYPSFAAALADQSVVREVSGRLSQVISSIERQIFHPNADYFFRLIRRHAVVFHIIRDLADEEGGTLLASIEEKKIDVLTHAIEQAAAKRYTNLRSRITRSVVRAVLFLLFTKMILALVIELPYEQFILKTTNWTPLLVNIFVHPLLLGIIGASAGIPEKKNTKRIVEEVLNVFGLEKEFVVTFRLRDLLKKGFISYVFRALYAVLFVFVGAFLISILYQLQFNSLSIAFFVFFLTLVTFFGYKIRETRKEVMVLETGGGVLGTLSDIFILPVLRAGRWIALRAPRVNVFLFFFDFIVEAPFKAAIGMIEGWLAYLREKKDEV